MRLFLLFLVLCASFTCFAEEDGLGETEALSQPTAEFPKADPSAETESREEEDEDLHFKKEQLLRILDKVVPRERGSYFKQVMKEMQGLRLPITSEDKRRVEFTREMTRRIHAAAQARIQELIPDVGPFEDPADDDF